MTTPCSGPISLGDVEVEVPGQPIGLGDSDVRAFADIPSGPISLFECYCLPNVIQELNIGEAYNIIVTPGFLGTEIFEGDWDIVATGFSGTPELVVTDYQIDLGYYGDSEPIFTFTGATKLHMEFEAFADIELSPTYRFNMRIFITAYWPQESGSTEQALDVAYYIVDWIDPG